MNGFASILLLTLFVSGVPVASEHAVIESVEATQDVSLDVDPTSAFWRASRPVYMEKDRYGKTIPRYRTEIRTRWTKNNLYFLFVCPYEQLHLKPAPNTQKETNELWNWDVAEVFVGSDFANIKRYKEFEISPQGEWVDLDIDLSKPQHEGGWTWNSGFEGKARIDEGTHTWYGAMRIPWAAVEARPPVTGMTMRINLFRSQGPPARQRAVTWQPPMNDSFHVPERFGLIRLVQKPAEKE
jgi:cellulose/xylan binding protein with CBM9 domain